MSLIFDVPIPTVRLLSFLVSETRLDRSNQISVSHHHQTRQSTGKSGATLALFFCEARFMECARKRPRFDGSVGDIARVVGPYASSMSWLLYGEDKSGNVSVSLIRKHWFHFLKNGVFIEKFGSACNDHFLYFVKQINFKNFLLRSWIEKLWTPGDRVNSSTRYHPATRVRSPQAH